MRVIVLTLRLCKLAQSCGYKDTKGRTGYTNQTVDCQQVKALIEAFKSISVIGEWPKNRLSGQVMIAAN